MKKRILAILMCIFMISVSVPCVTMAEESEQEEFEEKDKDEVDHKDEDSDEDEEDSDEDDEDSDDKEDEQEESESGDIDPEDEYFEDPSAEEEEPAYEEPVDEEPVDEYQIEEPVAAEEIPEEADIDAELVEEEYYETDMLNPFALQDEVMPPSMADDTWQGYPLSYHYNWDNSQNCWNWGEWYNGVCYKTPEGTYDTNVRHGVGLYCDGQNIHLYVKFARIYQTKVNGDQFTFAVDGQSATFRFVFADNGSYITGSTRAPGVYPLDLRNGDGSMSGTSTGFVGNLTVHENNENDELELVIPLELLKTQNSAINLDTFSAITFFNPNLMYKTQTCAGAGNGKLPFVLGSLAIFAGTFLKRKRFLFL